MVKNSTCEARRRSSGCEPEEAVRLRGSREEVVVVVVVVNRGDGRPEELYGPNLNKKQRGNVNILPYLSVLL
jgi:hypothetical protein